RPHLAARERPPQRHPDYRPDGPRRQAHQPEAAEGPGGRVPEGEGGFVTSSPSLPPFGGEGRGGGGSSPSLNSVRFSRSFFVSPSPEGRRFSFFGSQKRRPPGDGETGRSAAGTGD